MPLFRLFRHSLPGLAAGLLIAFATPGRAEPLPVPTGTVVLTVAGAITETNAPGVAQFDLAMLSALGQETVQTSTLWTEGVQSFTGVSLKALLDRVGASGGIIDATALNDYVIQIPVTDAVTGGPILAYEQNGVVLSVRDKGPLWVIYPYDSDAVWRTEVIYSRSIWQLARLTISP